MASFVQRIINTSFSQGAGATGEAGTSNFSLNGLRTTCRITNASGDGSKAELSLQVYGMPLSLMNDLSVIGLQSGIMQRRNTVKVDAGDAENGLSEVFTGIVNRAWPDMQNMPQVCFRVEATAGAFDAVKPGKPVSFNGPTPLPTVANAIVQQMSGRSLEVSGTAAKIMLDSPYYYGSPYKMLEMMARHARVGWTDENEKTVAIWPMMKSRDTAGSVMF